MAPSLIARALALLLLALPLAARADGFSIPVELPARMEFTGRLHKHPEPGTYTLTRTRADGRDVLHAVWRSPTRDIDAALDGSTGRPLRVVATDRAGGYTATLEYTSTGANYRYEKSGKPVREKFIAHADLYDSFTLDILFLGFPFHAPRKIGFALIDTSSPKGNVYNMTIAPDGEKTFTIGGKPVRCHRLKLSVAGFLGVFAPDYNFYYTVDPPHAYVALAGPDEEYTRSDL
jgi:hypothetical protein